MKAAFPYSQELMQCHAVTPCCHWTHLQRNPFLDPSSVRFFNTENIQDSWNWAKTISRYPNARHWPQSLGYLHRNLDPPILLLPVSSTEALPWSGHPKHLVSDSARKKQKTSFPPLLNFLDAFREPWGRRWSQHTPNPLGVSGGLKGGCANVMLLLLAHRIRLQLKLDWFSKSSFFSTITVRFLSSQMRRHFAIKSWPLGNWDTTARTAVEKHEPEKILHSSTSNHETALNTT